jgi:hypothetical protein
MMKLRYEPLETRQVEAGTVVVYDWGQLSETTNPCRFSNVQFFDNQANLVWTVNGMDECRYWREKNDIFVGVNEKNGGVQLVAYSGYAYDVDMETGKVKYSEFLK